MSNNQNLMFSKALERLCALAFLGFLYASIVLPSEGICQLVEVPLKERIKDAKVIFEGKVVKSEGFMFENRIYTAHTVELSKKFKGEINTNQAIYVTQGGRVGTKMQTYSPSFNLNIGDFGLFLGVDQNLGFSSSVTTFISASYSQGFIKYDLKKQTANDPFKGYSSIRSELYSEILSESGTKLQFVQKNNSSKSDGARSFAITITSISPAQSFFGELLTIEGSGFGTNGELFFTDRTGQQTVGALEIITWTPTRIVVRIPNSARSGKIKIVNEFNETAVSQQTLELSFQNSNTLAINGVSQGEFAETEEVTLFGVAFGTNKGSVYFTDENGNQTIEAEIVSWSNGMVVVRVPRGAKTGKVKLFTSEKQFTFSQQLVTIKPAATPVVMINVSPLSIAAGVRNVLTIEGSGFGTFVMGQGAGTEAPQLPMMVGFQSIFSVANPGLGVNLVYASPQEIVSWSDTKIEVMVPSGATSGKVVLQKLGTVEMITSPKAITITYNITNMNDEMNVPSVPYLYNQNQRGGHSFVLADNFKTNILATDAFKRAMESWRCGTGVNFDISVTGVGGTCQNGNDFINSVSFDKQCPLNKGVIAYTYRNYEFCSKPTGGSLWLLKDVDIMFSATTQWNLTAFTTKKVGGKDAYDFETASLTQLGYAMGIDWVNNPSSAMHYAAIPNKDRRKVNVNIDVPAGKYIVNRPIIGCESGMRALITGECKFPKAGASDEAPIADFTVAETIGCAPFTAQFMSIGDNSGNSVQWDIDNDGHTDYIGESISHVYTKPGVYSVRLVVYNEFTGLDIEVKRQLITVNAAPTIFVDRTSAATCDGGTVVLKASGSNSYIWESGDGQKGYYSTFAFKPTRSTMVTVTGMTTEGCSVSTTIPVTVYQLPGVNVQTIQPVKGNDGALVVFASSANPPYLYKVNNMGWQSSNLFTGLPSGTHVVYVQDGMGCSQSRLFTLNGVNNCPVPSNLTTEVLSNTSAQITWTAPMNAKSYIVQYQREGMSGQVSTTTNMNTVTLNGLEPNNQYTVKVTAVCENGSSAATMPANFRTTVQSTCMRPNVILSNVMTNSIQVDWSGYNMISHTVYYTDNKTFTWSQVTVPVGIMTYTISNLTPATPYQIYVLANCGNNVTVKSSVQEVATLLQSTNNCDAPTSMMVAPNAVDAKISWSSVNSAIGYSVKWKMRETTKWRTQLFIASQNNFTIPNLIPNSVYDIIVKTICDGGESKEWISNFVTKMNRSEENSGFNNVSLYPNPNNGSFTISNSNGWDNANLIIIDVQGKIVFEQTLLDNESTINANDLAKGLYLVKIINKGATTSQRISIE